MDVLRAVLRLLGFEICSDCHKIIKDYSQGYPICDQCHWNAITHGSCIHCGNDIEYPYMMCVNCLRFEDDVKLELAEEERKRWLESNKTPPNFEGDQYPW